ncbi:MAG: biopolymer transporter ExbD [Terrimicrobiaceae bacterium]|nr:biopolymer transporter ExbD [Terrimicrobiaceae bacterium]
MKLIRRAHPAVEIQMGPMIDMVFLLLVFFMVTAKPIKQESDLNIGLPGTVAQEETLDIPDEQRILIRADGQVILNDLPMDSPANEDLPSLVATLKRFKESADANKAEALVTIDAEDGARHQRIVSVLNACAKAGITGVTFADASPEEDA